MTKTEKLESVLQQVKTDLDPFGNPRDPYEIFLEDDYPEPRYTLSVGGVGTIPLGDIISVKAKSKNGKSYVASIFVAAIHDAEIFGMKSNLQGSTILYFDTEQNGRNTARILRRIHSLIGYNLKQSLQQIRAFSLREQDTLQRFPHILSKIDRYKPSVIVIDGIADLIQDFNDVKESEEIINKIMKLSAEKDIAVICIIHTNKQKDDNNMKGHLGSLLVQKSSDVFEVKKQGSTFTVTETESRNQPIDDFSFVLDKDGFPRPTVAPIPINQQLRDNEITNAMAKIFEGENILQYNELVRRYEKIANVCSRTAKGRIKTAVANGFIEQVESGGYRLPVPSAGD